MPKAKKTKPVSSSKVGFLAQIKWGESYTSLFLGAVVVVVALVLVFSFVRSRNNLNKGQTGSTSTISKEQEAAKAMPKTYTVKSGDYLWSIAVRAYGDGYQWVKIVKANNLVNPDLIFSGNVLRLPR